MSEEMTTIPQPPVPPVRTTASRSKAPIRVRLLTEFPLHEPELGIRFEEGDSVEVPQMTRWIQAQIEAGIMVQEAA